jgi:hypothetical protein
MSGYPWSAGDALLASDLNAAIAGAGGGGGGGGAYLPLAGGTLSGMLGITGTRTWPSGAFPQTSPAIYQSLTYTGTATAGLPGPEGTSVPINVMSVAESINAPGMAVNGLHVQMGTMGGDGGRHGVLVTHQVLGNVGTSNTNYVGAQIFQQFNANVAGAAAGAGNGKGDTFGMGIQINAASGTHLHGMTGLEIDMAPFTGSTVDYIVGLQIINMGNTSVIGNVFDAMMLLATGNPSIDKKSNFGLHFGNPQSADGLGFPLATTGTMIGSRTGTTGYGIDFSNVTFNNAFIKGPNSFQIAGSAGFNTISSGSAQLVFTGSATPVASFVATAAAPYGAAVTLDATAVTGGQKWSLNSTAGAAGEGQGLLAFVNGSGFTPMTIDKFGVTRFPYNDVIVSSGTALATNASNRFFSIPAMAGTPTGTPDVRGNAFAQMVWDSTAKKLWIYDNVTTTWKGAVHT